MSDPAFDRLLRDLESARDEALDRVDASLRGDVPPAPAVGRTPPDSPEPPARTTRSESPTPTSAPVSSGPARPSRLAALARPVAALVLTAAAVLGAWLLVLEPALGSRPVLVRDEAMSPSLRTGDVALAVDPDGPLGEGAIVAVRRDGRATVTRVIGREDVPVTADPEARAAAGYVVRADGEPLEVSHVVPVADVLGEVGAAVPRVGLALVLLRDPSSSPGGALVVLALLALTVVGARDIARERRGPRE